MSRSYSHSGVRCSYGVKRLAKAWSKTKERADARMALGAEREPRPPKEIRRQLDYLFDDLRDTSYWRYGEVPWYTNWHPEQISPKIPQRTKLYWSYLGEVWEDEYQKPYKWFFTK